MSSHESTAPETSELDYEPAEPQDEWLDEPEELPRRPRRRLLAPVPLALLAALLVACGFIGGVLVQKGQGGTGSAGGASSGFASRLAALKEAAPGASRTAGGASPGGGSASRSGAGGFPGLGGSTGGGVTTGEVAYVRGDTLYVTDSQGNTVKVTASAAAKVTKAVSTKAQSIHPGSTVVVLGSKAKNGAIRATSITVDSATSTGATGPGTTSSSTGAGAGPTTLFGPG
jgi:hypothetical protein